MTDSVIQPSYSSRLAEILIPPSLRSDDRSGRLYFWFVTCHLVAGLLALGLALWVYHEAHELLPSYWLFISLSASLLAQPVLFRFSGAYGLLSVMSVLILNAMVLVAVYNFGGYLSPALPVTVIIPLFCLLFLSNLGQIVGLSALAGGYGILITLFANGHEFPRYLDGTDLSGLFLAGVIVAAVGVAAVARAYLDLYAMSREVLRAEVARHKNTADNLAKARNLATHATRTKSQSIAAICDEIRMPLNAMIGFSQIISRELMGQLTDERYRTCASDIESSGRHLLGVVDEVLDLVRVQTGDLELIDTEFELADLIEKSCMA
ncbi:MAG: hypothetical protein HN732_20750, partial [Rhodospirillaceae bacterium]|nr:hypothetical protein [Rhodospirillaceae bacterium]